MKFSVTGGAGFIGSALVRHLVKLANHQVQTIDKLTYAASLRNIEDALRADNHEFCEIDICEKAALNEALHRFQPDVIVHLAAETHVDRSIEGPWSFVETNIIGTYNVLQAARGIRGAATGQACRLVHVSTDEVFGSLGASGSFDEFSAYQPNSPYAASKASADHLARAWHTTFEVPVMITNCSNNYGPHQFPEKLIPLTVDSALNGRPINVYGDGLQIRDWLYVDDHVDALVRVAEQGKVGHSYNIGARCELTNRQVVNEVLTALADVGGFELDGLTALVRHVEDRPGHDRRYAINPDKIVHDLGWSPRTSFEKGIRKTVRWYLENRDWCREVAASYRGERLGVLHE